MLSQSDCYPALRRLSCDDGPKRLGKSTGPSMGKHATIIPIDISQAMNIMLCCSQKVTSLRLQFDRRRIRPRLIAAVLNRLTVKKNKGVFGGMRKGDLPQTESKRGTDADLSVLRHLQSPDDQQWQEYTESIKY